MDFDVVVGRLFEVEVENEFALINEVSNSVGTEDVSLDWLVSNCPDIEISLRNFELDLVCSFGSWIIQLN